MQAGGKRQEPNPELAFRQPGGKDLPVPADTARFNEAARLEGQSRGGDIVMSREFADDPRIAGASPPAEETGNAIV